MCKVCGRTPCDPRCPEAEPPKVVCGCIKCGWEIYAREPFLKTSDGAVCEDCLEQMEMDDWLELFDVELTIIDE